MDSSRRALKKVLGLVGPLVDILMLPAALISAICSVFVRRYGIDRLPATRAVFRIVGVLPVRHHYHEPVVYPHDLRQPLSSERSIVGLDLREEDQLRLLRRLNYAEELAQIPLRPTGATSYYYENGAFEQGDAEFLYAVIRHFKPRRLVEIGAGFSTLMARKAIEHNRLEELSYDCDHVCIEPYENKWLEATGARVIRERVERVSLGVFNQLASNDILFIDSSHVIRPQGDVIYEYLEVLGHLGRGVLLHVHDIFTPRDYPEDWVLRKQRLWNEQYLLEAYLCFNREYNVIAALNFLWHHHRSTLLHACPMLATKPNAEPGSFWMVRV
ncbi:MAG: class I SAM-dependent methyltransferase [Deltaproteobacteria bacterium]|nr:class I SAM-dependent methyltransferase [Deltaproteobacteria bacterium]